MIGHETSKAGRKNSFAIINKKGSILSIRFIGIGLVIKFIRLKHASNINKR